MLSNLVNVNILTNPYKFRVYRTSATNSGAGAFALLPFDTKNYDTGTNVDVVTNKGRFTVPLAGFYNFAARCSTTNAATWIISIYKNGSEVARGSDSRYSAAAVGVNVSTTLQLAANDYIEIYVFGDLARALDVSQPSLFNYFSGFLVSAA